MVLILLQKYALIKVVKMYLLIAVVSVWTHESCCSWQLLTSPSFSASVIRRLLTINQQKLSAQVGLTGRTLQVEAGTSSEERRNVSWWVQFFSLLAYKQFMSLRLSSDEGSRGPACRLCCCWHVQKVTPTWTQLLSRQEKDASSFVPCPPLVSFHSLF